LTVPIEEIQPSVLTASDSSTEAAYRMPII
jgi:hypothetical protein